MLMDLRGADGLDVTRYLDVEPHKVLNLKSWIRGVCGDALLSNGFTPTGDAIAMEIQKLLIFIHVNVFGNPAMRTHAGTYAVRFDVSENIEWDTVKEMNSFPLKKASLGEISVCAQSTISTFCKGSQLDEEDPLSINNPRYQPPQKKAKGVVLSTRVDPTTSVEDDTGARRRARTANLKKIDVNYSGGPEDRSNAWNTARNGGVISSDMYAFLQALTSEKSFHNSSTKKKPLRLCRHLHDLYAEEKLTPQEYLTYREWPCIATL